MYFYSTPRTVKKSPSPLFLKMGGNFKSTNCLTGDRLQQARSAAPESATPFAFRSTRPIFLRMRTGGLLKHKIYISEIKGGTLSVEKVV